MSDLPAQHYLDTYRTRLWMVDSGITHPRPEVVAGMRQLVSGLSAMQPDVKIRLEMQSCKALFKVAATGDLITEIPIIENAEPGTAPNGGPATPSGNSEVTDGPPPVS